eukprot:CAMPEP_0172538468 /NCGR_PEP_ID=MMETSP1067-20121228/9855_1 /TAXON_ID=265564 ORGANISM="Thalassiosira punctigera, Strain Tpunct2005C2" /NCGR_SAMPLE_ID=MMETSP1067 /ASSEMBLY_ACC=CAM_ASM_000444 /LENGTH=60 /DNA_ID=CAMNT_0013323971 /DNA_START=1 /DNA_END=183 /DNA_ORIENTATION=-
MLIAKGVMKWKEHKAKLESMEIQMGRKGEEVGKDWRPRAKGGTGKYDPENDLTVAQFETV